eukprot:792567-Prorocentrum_minimum.AAC.11
MDIPLNSDEVFDLMPNLAQHVRTPKTPDDRKREEDGVLEFMKAKVRGWGSEFTRNFGNYCMPSGGTLHLHITAQPQFRPKSDVRLLGLRVES